MVYTVKPGKHVCQVWLLHGAKPEKVWMAAPCLIGDLSTPLIIVPPGHPVADGGSELKIGPYLQAGPGGGRGAEAFV